ncbi:MAG: dihydroxyacetone kinase subunit L [Caldilineaceae bacterium]|nr:dihydroxyacetone kinase subunit L [Caldilineaceae bacterium]
MTRDVTLEQMQRWLLHYADQIEQEQATLTRLDAAIGDADHGVNMQHGAEKMRAKINDLTDCHDIDVFLRTIAMTLISSIGGAAGPLYGVFFLRASKEAGPGDVISLDRLAQMFLVGLESIQQRGHARLGDKTMVDALAPAVEALRLATDAGQSTTEALAVASEAAEAGMLATIDMEAKKGRASYLGPRSIGHQDPGATSAYLLVASAAATLGS